MILRIRLYIYCLVVMSLALPLQAVVAVSAKHSVNPAGVLTETQTRIYIAEMIPLVERFAGKKFLAHPKMKLVTSAQMVPILTNELIPQLRSVLAENDDNNISLTAENTAIAFSTHLLGKYGTNLKCLFILPENIRPRMKEAKVDRKHETAFIRLVIAHELTHALQDQYVGLAHMLNRSKNPDQSLAASSTIEGHAIYVQEKVAQTLHLQESQKEYARAIGADESSDPMEKLVGALGGKLISDTYLAGRDFIVWQMRNGGFKKVWKVLKDPPVKSSMILHPETYAPIVVDTIDYNLLLSGIDKLFGIRKWIVMNVEIGEMQVRALYNDLEPTLRDEVLAEFEHAQALSAMDGISIASVTIITLKTPKVFPHFVVGLEDICKKNVEKLDSSKSVKVKDFEIGSFTNIKSDTNSRITFKMTSGDASLPNQFVRIVRGRVMLEFYFQDAEISDSSMGEIAESIFNKLPSNYCMMQ